MSRRRARRTTTLAGLEEEFRHNTESAADLTSRLDPLQLLWTPGEGEWSIAQCLDHLAVTAAEYQPALERSLKRARRSSGSSRRHGYGFFARQFMARMEPPVRSRYPAPRSFRPQKAPDLSSVLAGFAASRSRYERLLDLASRRAWWRAKAPNPLIPAVRLNCGDWFGIMAAHDRRHLWQASQVTQHHSFPPPLKPQRPIVL